MIDTAGGIQMDSALLQNYLHSLIGRIYKILPMWEQGEQSVVTYMDSLLVELAGCRSFVLSIRNDASYLSIISTVQFLIDNPDYPVKCVRREIFRLIGLCNKMESMYSEEAV